MSMNDLMASLQMFQNGARELAVGNAFRSAADQASQINLQQQDEFEKRQQMQMLGQQLAAQLSAVGASGQQVQQGAAMYAPQQINGPQDMFQQAAMAKPGSQAQQQWQQAGQQIQSGLANAPLTRFQNEQIKIDKYRLLNESLAMKAAGAGKSIDDLMLGADKKTIETLASKQAGKISIANTLQTVVDEWKNLSPDAQLQQGREILKTLNSPEGADAIGVEEANRLGSKLEFVLSGNIFNSNPTQFGRDMEGFYADLKNSTRKIQKSVERNDLVISKIYKKYGVDVPVMKQTPDEISTADEGIVKGLETKLNQMTPEQIERLRKVKEIRSKI